MAAANLSATTITFGSQAALEAALKPLGGLSELERRMSNAAASLRLQFTYEDGLTPKITPLRNTGVGDLLHTPLYSTELLTVYYPEKPRVPHHLAIALHRRNFQGISAVTEEENSALHETIRKIYEVYKSINVKGAVISEHDTPQEGHLGLHVVELIPHLPGFHDIKNDLDKAESNHHVLFRKANLTKAIFASTAEQIAEEAALWQQAFKEQHAPLDSDDIEIAHPRTNRECFKEETDELQLQQLIEILEDNGGIVREKRPFQAVLPTHTPDPATIIPTVFAKCAFCNDTVINRQLVFEYGSARILYNYRKNIPEGGWFLVVPKRHIEKVYGLKEEEIKDIATLINVLTAVLKESFPGSEVITYTQDIPSVGQNVFHQHRHVLAIDPETIALTWTALGLYPDGNVSAEEMERVCKGFGQKIEAKFPSEVEEPESKQSGDGLRHLEQTHVA